MGQNCIFEDNIGVLKMFVFEKNDPLLSSTFSIRLLGEEIWVKNCIFQDNIRLWVLKMLVLKKMTHFYLGIFQIRIPGEEIRGKKLNVLK